MSSYPSNHKHRPKLANTTIRISVYTLVLIGIIVALVFASQAHAVGPVWMAYYCRQQCDQRYKMCTRSACESACSA